MQVIQAATNWAAEPMHRALASHRLSVIDRLTRRRRGSALALRRPDPCGEARARKEAEKYRSKRRGQSDLLRRARTLARMDRERGVSLDPPYREAIATAQVVGKQAAAAYRQARDTAEPCASCGRLGS